VTAPSVLSGATLAREVLDHYERKPWHTSLGGVEPREVVLARDLQIAQANVKALTEALDAAMQYVDPKDRAWIESLAAVEFDKSHSVEATSEEK
jgi:hypothetical protein